MPQHTGHSLCLPAIRMMDHNYYHLVIKMILAKEREAQNFAPQIWVNPITPEISAQSRRRVTMCQIIQVRHIFQVD